MTVRDFLRLGDVLLYRPTSLFGYLIAVKTWRAISHVEAYVGAGESVASRDGIGVGIYPLRTAGLVRILRPRAPFDLGAAMRWFATVEGQRYDWLGLFRFLTWRERHPHDRMFCSAFVVRWLRRGGLEPFQPDVDADSVPPGELLLSPLLADYVVNGDVVTPAHVIQFVEGR